MHLLAVRKHLNQKNNYPLFKTFAISKNAKAPALQTTGNIHWLKLSGIM